MQHEEVVRELKVFFIREVLEGRDADFDAKTPLLEWGLLDSFSLVKVLGMIDQRWGISIPPAQLVPRNLQDLESIASLLMKLSGAAEYKG
jgi:acyl carrier protein